MTNDISNITTKDRLIAICDRITDFFDWDMEREEAAWNATGSRRITVDENIRKTVYKAKIEAMGNHGLGISSLYERIQTPGGWGVGFVDLFGYKDASDFNINEINSQREFAIIIMDLVQLYEDWKIQEFEPMVADISDTLNNDKTDAFEVTPVILEAVNKLVMKGTFKSYKYRDAGDVIGLDDEFHISTVIGFSRDLTMWMNHIQSQEEFLSNQADNKVFVTLFGKLDEISPIYSNWLFTLHKGKTIWIVTDQVDADNPYQKFARLERRSVWRDRDQTYGECDLPYNLFHDIDELIGPKNKLAKNSAFIREPFVNFETTIKDEFTSWDDRNAIDKHTKLLESLFKQKLDALGVDYDLVYSETTNSSFKECVESMEARRDGHTVAFAHNEEIVIYKHAEVFFKSMTDIKSGQRTFAVLLIKEMMQYLASDVKLDTIMLASEHIEHKLLEGAKISPNEPEHMSYWTKEHKEIFNELLETLEDGEDKTSAIAVRTYDVVKKSTYYNASWLTTPDRHTSLAEWTIIEDEKNKLYPKLKELADLRGEAETWLNNILQEKYDEIVLRMTMAKEIVFTNKVCTDGFSSKMKKGDAGSVFESTAKGVDSKRGKGIGKTKWTEEYCIPCTKNSKSHSTAKIVKRIQILHYKELMWLLGFTDRKQLHKYYRQFRSYNLIPYSGNSLLDQTHPFLRIIDPCSNTKSSGFCIDLFMCGRCYKRIKQEDTLTINF